MVTFYELLGCILLLNTIIVIFHIFLYISIKKSKRIYQLAFQYKLKHIDTSNIIFYHAVNDKIMGIDIPFVGKYVYVKNSDNTLDIFDLLIAIHKSNISSLKYIIITNIMLIMLIYGYYITVCIFTYITVRYFLRYDRINCVCYALNNMYLDDLLKLKEILSKAEEQTFLSLIFQLFTDEISSDLLNFLTDKAITKRNERSY